MTITGRFEPSPERGELATYRFYLDGHRRVLAARCAGLSPEQLATASLPPSDLSLLGLVRHLGRVEHVWFRIVLAGHADEPMLDPDDATGGFRSIAPTAASVEGATVGEALNALYEEHNELRERIADGDGSLRRFVNVYLKGEDIRFLDGLDTPVADGDEVTILPEVAGG